MSYDVKIDETVMYQTNQAPKSSPTKNEEINTEEMDLEHETPPTTDQTTHDVLHNLPIPQEGTNQAEETVIKEEKVVTKLMV